jgi:hypothetical protein
MRPHGTLGFGDACGDRRIYLSSTVIGVLRPDAGDSRPGVAFPRVVGCGVPDSRPTIGGFVHDAWHVDARLRNASTSPGISNTAEIFVFPKETEQLEGRLRPPPRIEIPRGRPPHNQ